jgi:hypothetical protein
MFRPTWSSSRALQAYSSNTWTHKRVYTSQFYTLTEVQQFSTAIFEARDDDHIGRNIQCTSDAKTNFKIKKKENVNFKI